MLLNCHSFFSHNYGTIPTKELVSMAAAFGYPALALTDINNTCTSLDFVHECREQGIKPVLGIDFRNMQESARQLYIGIALNNEGFREMNAWLSLYLHSKEPLPERPPHFSNAIIIYPFQPAMLGKLAANEYIGIRPQDIPRLIQIPEDKLRHKAVALCPVSFRDPGEYYMHCLLRAADHNTLLSKLQPQQAGTRDECMPAPTTLLDIYQRYPYILQNSSELLERCHIDFDYTQEKNKRAFGSSIEEDKRILREMCFIGLVERYGAGHEEATQRMEKELNVISQKNFVAYFLTSWDIVRYAHSQGYFTVGRGSGANSIAAYCLRITDVDPIELDLYFERFLNMHRNSPPDFDLDFSWKDREDITRYIFDKYGNEYTALLGSHSTFKFRAVARELGKVYGLPKHEIDNFIGGMEMENRLKGRKGSTPMDRYKEKIMYFSNKLAKFPDHLSVHASGLVVSDISMHYYTATSLPPKGFPITHFDMYTADKFKLHKLDILSQRGLGHIKDTIALVKENQGVDIDITQVASFYKNPELNAKLVVGDSIGCFYIESPAMRQLMRKLHCDNFLTLVAASSIIRPGVSDSGMGKMYIMNHRNPERYKPIHPLLGEILKETYGIMVYQEDIIKVAHEFAGLSLAGADILRRAMAWKFRVDNGFDKMEKEFFDNCRARGYSEYVTREVWRQMEGFAGFSFCKAHSASYAVESYQSLYLKTYFPREFMVGVINNFGGYYNTEFYVNEARRCGANIHAPCINRSNYLTHIYGIDIYLGFIHIKSLQGELAEQMIAEREAHGLYRSLQDFYTRMQPGQEQLLILVRIGAFRFTGKTKRQLLWEALLLSSGKKQGPKGVQNLFPETVKEFRLPRLSQTYREDALQEIELLGFPICSRFDLLATDERGEIKAKDMENNIGKTVMMMGYLTNTKGTKTSKGDYMQFGSFLDDERHTFEAVLFPPVYQKGPLSGHSIYKMWGKITSDYDVCSLEVQQWERMELDFNAGSQQALNSNDQYSEGEGTEENTYLISA